MKIVPILAAAAVAALAMPLAAAPASAQHVRVSINDGHHRHHGWRNVCRWEWRHHHKVRVCHRTRW